MASYRPLSARSTKVLHSILYGPSKGSDPIRHKGNTRPITEKMVKKYFNFFNGDADEIRSICYEAALDAVTKYAKKPENEIMAIAVRIMRNRILNASKALGRKKRGGEYRHLSLGVGARLIEAWEEEGEHRGDLYDTSRTGAYTLLAPVQNPLDRAIAVQEIEQTHGSVRNALKKLLS